MPLAADSTIEDPETLRFPTTMFNSPYLAEHYDLFCNRFYDTQLLDVPIYWKLLLQVRASRSHPDPFVVLDIGTGTGRILNAFALNAENEGIKFASTEFLGLDISSHMLKRASSITQIPKGSNISWVPGSALDLESIPNLQGGSSKVDFMFFTTGSFSRLCHPGEPERFFANVAKTLRPGCGRACISILKSLMPDETSSSTIDLIEAGEQIQSKSFPNIRYTTIVRPSETTNGVHIDKREIIVTEQIGNREKVVERNLVSSHMKLWNRDELIDLARAAGLRITDIIPGTVETYFIFGLE